MTSSDVCKDHQHDSAKRRQIMDGARAAFLEHGFDTTSMGEIARRAGVSKGTLYVYFTSKEELFEATVEEETKAEAEELFALDATDSDVAAVLTRLGIAFTKFLCLPSKVSSIRTVISISERMPVLGLRFYEAGPERGTANLARYLQAQTEAGTLIIGDCEVAAAQFLDSCQSTLFKPMIFAAAEPPTDERVEHVVGCAVRTFLAAYARRG